MNVIFPIYFFILRSYHEESSTTEISKPRELNGLHHNDSSLGIRFEPHTGLDDVCMNAA